MSIVYSNYGSLATARYVLKIVVIWLSFVMQAKVVVYVYLLELSTTGKIIKWKFEFFYIFYGE